MQTKGKEMSHPQSVTAREHDSVNVVIPDSECVNLTSDAEPSAESQCDSQDKHTFTVGKGRVIQLVTALVLKKKVVKWMTEQDEKGVTKLLSKTVRQFPTIFRAHDPGSIRASIMKATRWWKDCVLIMNVENMTSSRLHKHGRKHYLSKAIEGRRRKRQP
jgi:hypothetical protein